MWKKLKDWFIPAPEPVPDITTDPPRPSRKRRPRRPPTETATLSPKEQATAEGRPWVNVLGLEFDPQNPTVGSFELDWNELFVKQLLMSGFQGDTEEQIVDQWFQGICRHVVAETWEQVQADPSNRVSRKDLGNGRIEVG